MIRGFDFHQLAQKELEEAFAYYEQQSPGLGHRFSADLEHVVRFIAEFPQAGIVVRPGIRRALLPKFPYSVLYRVRSSSILIVAVAHHKRQPEYWASRT